MAFNLPTPQYLFTRNATNNRGFFRAEYSDIATKSGGNLPLTTNSAEVGGGNGEKGIYFGMTAQESTTSIDASSGTKVILTSLQFNAPNRIQIDTIGNRGAVARLTSGTGATNFLEYSIGGNDTPFASSQAGSVTICIDLNSLSNDLSGGTFDPSDVTGWGYGSKYLRMAGNASNLQFFTRLFLFDTEKGATNLPTFTGASSFDDAFSAVNGSDYTDKIGTWVQKLSTAVFIPCPFSIGDGVKQTSFNDSGATVISPQNNGAGQENFRLTTDAMRVYLDTRDNALDTATLSGSYSWGTAAEWDFDISNASTCVLSGAFNGMGTFTLGSSVTATGTFALASGSSVVCNGATIDSCTIDGDLKLQGISTTSFTDVSANNVEFDTAGTYQFNKCDIASVTNTSGGTVTIENTGSTIGTNTDPTIIIQDLRGISITNIVAGSRMQIFNTTTGLEINNEIIVGTDYIVTYAEGTGFTEDDVVRVRLMYTNTTTSYTEFETTVIASSTGWSVLAAQAVDTVYTAIGIDGTVVTKFTADYLGNDVNLNINQNFEIAEFYAWWKYNLFLSQGISDFFGVLTALDEANFRINNSVLDFFLDSTATASVRQLDNRRIYRADLAYPVRQPTTNGFGLDVVWRNIIFVAPVDRNVPALTSAQSTQLGNIVDVLADTNELQANQGNFATATGFSTFNPASDTVANVTLVATTTTNTDMRGTDGSNTVAPDNTSITTILADTNELQANQGNFATATGFSTFDPSADAVANVTLVATTTTNTDMRGTDGANTVTPANTIISAILTDTNELQQNQGNFATATGFSSSAEITALDVKVEQVKTNQEVINNGVQEASLLIPHITNLP